MLGMPWGLSIPLMLAGLGFGFLSHNGICSYISGTLMGAGLMFSITYSYFIKQNKVERVTKIK